MGDQTARDGTISVGKLVLLAAILGPTLGVINYLLKVNEAQSIGLLTVCVRSTLSVAIALTIVAGIVGRRHGFAVCMSAQSGVLSTINPGSTAEIVLRAIVISLFMGVMLRLLYMIPALGSRHPAKSKDAPTASTSAVGGIWDRDLDG